MDFLKIIVEDIHSSIFATVDDNGDPVTCAIDLMDYDDDGLYFLTAKGKNFYSRLINHPTVAFTAMKGEDTMSSIAISVQGKVEEIGKDRLGRLFEKNPYMKDIYPDEERREPLTVFRIYEGRGELFDLSKLPIERHSFNFGMEAKPEKQNRTSGYFITDKCIGCGSCYSKCPPKCIDLSRTPLVIDQTHCYHCGACYEVCPVGAVDKNL